MKSSLHGTVVALAVVVLSTHLAFADDSKTDAARAHAEEAMKFYNLGDFNHAIAEYKAAYSAVPDPAFLYNIAQAYRVSNNLQQALFFYRSFLRSSPDAPNRDEVQDRIHKLEEQIKAQESLSTSPPTSTIPPQGKPIQPSAPPPSPMSTTSSSTQLTRQAPPPHEPVYKKWWLWTGVGVVAVGVAVGVGLGIGLSQPQPPASHFGNTGVF